MRIDVRKTWKCIVWTGPQGEAGHGAWLLRADFTQDAAWCAHMDSLYPGWNHSVQKQKGTPRENTPEGWESHPLFGNMQAGPMGL